ncbi:hypothetical protein ACC764_36445 [Rhizobium ruizarguesonis]|uniref:Uncharacterized protein n=1 Tax=Rhizobium ruizarguesonis TaxID=2081791 RepID=A0AB38HQH3_9HYPH|nr:hypothetical protein [Rhizobium ruizarguesonis]TAW60666.1 hypothetical protein ELI10_37775 [Rhizobium ruizarguesonis]TAX01482.1 hypothetical protein ELI09_37280 [Rhizobium ruizarguesonis]TAX03499.1 hypothetical protein ELI08_36990 [Rhizobium ruizarguesonis]TAY82612.1 hypothetical protein ELH85_38000 [Rhizobium ruizarguesonis]TAZ65665.1 hypothetical protein ELH68_37330 [Rhizobium ruizarguesonis]
MAAENAHFWGPHRILTSDDAQVPYAEDSLSVEANGEGTISGADYMIPAHSEGWVTVKIKIPALTSQQAQYIDALYKSLLSVSARQKVESYESVHGEGNLSFFKLIFGGAKADYGKTRHLLKEEGLSEDNIKTLVSAIADIAKTMSIVTVKIHINNMDNDYSVAGELKIWTISGKVISDKHMTEYRVLATKGTAGSDGATAPTNVEVIPLN